MECGSTSSRLATVKRSFGSVPLRDPGAPLPGMKAEASFPGRAGSTPKGP